jgi:uncharacterized membrane protein
LPARLWRANSRAVLIWVPLTIAAAGLQVLRNAAQRELTGPLGLWGAAYVRFCYGLPFGLAWLAAILLWKGLSGGPGVAFLGYATTGALCQGAAMACLVIAMQGRVLAVATALSKAEVLGAALIGLAILGDTMSPVAWAGVLVATVGVSLTALAGASGALATPGAVRAAGFGILSGLFFSVSSVCYRGGSLAWGGDPWVGAAATLIAALSIQTVVGAALLATFRPAVLVAVGRAWRASIAPGAAGAVSSALLFAAFALGPSAGAVKTVQLVDVLIAWALARRLWAERLTLSEWIGAGLIILGAAAVIVPFPS